MRKVAVSDTRTREMVTISRAGYETLKAQNEWLLEQLRVIRNKRFGSSSEKASEEVMEQLSLLFDEAEVYAAEEEGPSAVEVRSHTRKRKSGINVKGSYFSAQYQRIAARRGKNRAAVAVAHSMLIAIYHVLKYGVPFRDLGADYYNSFNREHKIRGYLKRLQVLGWVPDSPPISA